MMKKNGNSTDGSRLFRKCTVYVVLGLGGVVCLGWFILTQLVPMGLSTQRSKDTPESLRGESVSSVQSGSLAPRNPPSPLELASLNGSSEIQREEKEDEQARRSWAEFQALRSKVLKTGTERAEYYIKLESSEFLQQAIATLDAHPSDAIVMSVQSEGEGGEGSDRLSNERTRRIAAIDWMDEALSWRENPRRSEILSRLVQLVSRDISSLPLTSEAKETLAGDKIELIGLLAATDPAFANKLEAQASASKDARLFQYARSMYGIDF